LKSKLAFFKKFKKLVNHYFLFIFDVMKQTLSVICSFLFLVSYAQWQDDFSDGDFTTGKVWFGDVDSFEVQSERLWLNAPANSSRSYLSTESDASVDGSWEFFVEMGFNPSSTNRAFVYIISDQADLKAPLNGYYIMLGNTQDEVSLYRQNGASSTKIIDGIDGILNTSTVRVKVLVTRDAAGNWELFADTSVAFNNPISQGVVFDNTFMNSSYFGVLCQYTATRSNLFWYDDFEVTAIPYVDTDAPQLINYTVNNLQTLTLFFNESLDSLSATDESNFSVLPDLFLPDSVYYNSADFSTRLFFQNSLQGMVEYTLAVQGVSDLAGNAIDTAFNFTVKDAYAWNSAIINEIYPDENPSFGLPIAEFVELYNPTSDTLFTQGWRFANDNSFGNFPADTILPGEYIIICRSSAVAEYSVYGKTFSITSMPALKNASDELKVLDKYGTVLDSLNYFNSWYRNIRDADNNNKKDGGYTLERILAQNPCEAFYNWYPSEAEIGGTPGATNSVSAGSFDTDEPLLLQAFATQPNQIKVIFNEAVSPLAVAELIHFTISGGISVQAAQTVAGLQKEVILQVNPDLEPGQTYSLTVWGIEDCFGNEMQETEIEVYLALPPEPLDVVINEILFNPNVAGSDYLELYNKSGRALDLSHVKIVRFRIENPEEVMNQVSLSSQTLVMPPNSYFTFTSDTANVSANYWVENPQWLYQINLPNFPNSEAIAAITLYDTIILDVLKYRTNWHFELLDNQRGVSLERINPDGTTQDRHNWKSAAKGQGSGTPTYINSQFYQSEFTTSSLWVEPEVFTPDGDGYKDFTQIFYKVNETGYVANVAIFDAVGREIRQIANNELIPTQGQWRWDGTNKLGEKATIGIYIVLVELFSPSGKKEILKEKVVLGSRF
jgi:hypothetical protein